MSAIPENTTSDATQVPVVVSPELATGPHTKRWTREEYHQLAEQGWFQDERVELVDGEILAMSPQSYEHANAIHLLYEMIGKVFASGFSVRMQVPLLGGADSEPEPDLSVVVGSWQDYVDHPRTATLAIEVSLTTLVFDSSKKSNLYASMGVPDYWVLDLVNRQLIVFRMPVADDKADLGHRYSKMETIAADGHISPLEKPGAKLAVADMLPPVKK